MGVLGVIRGRRSTRAPFDGRPPSKEDVKRILEAARWAPTPHNMQNFEIVVVDDAKTIGRLGKIKSPISEAFIRENYPLLSFSLEALLKKGTGIMGAAFPKSWTTPPFDMEAIAREGGPSTLEDGIDGSPLLLVVLYDPCIRAPASEGDFLGILGLGCVMENIWLAAEELGISARILSEFGEEPMEAQIKKALRIPSRMRIAYAVRLGYPPSKAARQPGVRRETGRMAHRNRYGKKWG
jgi:nitroreductase